MADKGTPPYKKPSLLHELCNLRRPDGQQFILGAHMIHPGPNKGRLAILYHNNDENSRYVESFQDKLALHLYQYSLAHRKWNPRAVEKFMDSFVTSERYLAADSIWDKDSFSLRTLNINNAAISNFDADMEEAGCNNIAEGLLEAMAKDKKRQVKHKFDVEAMKRVEAMMGFHNREGCGISDINQWHSYYQWPRLSSFGHQPRYSM